MDLEIEGQRVLGRSRPEIWPWSKFVNTTTFGMQGLLSTSDEGKNSPCYAHSCRKDMGI